MDLFSEAVPSAGLATDSGSAKLFLLYNFDQLLGEEEDDPDTQQNIREPGQRRQGLFRGENEQQQDDQGSGDK